MYTYTNIHRQRTLPWELDVVYSSYTCSITFSTERFHYINFDNEYRLWLESPLRLLLCIYANQSVQQGV